MWEEINAAGLAQLVTDFCTWLGASLIYGLLYEARGDHAQTATVVTAFISETYCQYPRLSFTALINKQFTSKPTYVHTSTL